jgi:A/G-specific adenine glycosylase
MSSDASAVIVDRLLGWAATQSRPLPWRKPNATGHRNPYHVWVSEIMLQQTQAATVAPYYARWLQRFPTVTALAEAPLGDVLKVWEGLGYYARARNLHRAAQIVTTRHGGELPAERAALLALPGIGRSTAGAILSLAFGQRAAILDGNVKRVVSRLFDVETPLGESATDRRLWALSEGLVEAVTADAQAGVLNEALMDLGAAVCLPKNPACPVCPLLGLCQAQQQGLQSARPVRRPRRPLPYFDVTCGVIWDDRGRLLITQRHAGGMLGGLWEFPGGKQEPGETLEACLVREIEEELGIQIAVGAKLVAVPHTYTHLKITLHAYECRWVSGTPQTLDVAAWAWVQTADLLQYAFPVTDQKVLRALQTRLMAADAEGNR